MKRIVIVLILALIVATGTVFADHPNGLGIGIVGGWYGNWGGGGYGNYGLSLKVPVIPVFWGINLHIKDTYFSLGITGDKYLFDSTLVKSINLGWYLGIGLWGGVTIFEKPSFSVGARAPIGLNWRPIDILEIFLDVAPSVGISVINPFEFPVGGWPVELGIRFWL
ncbi:MAG: hypothetical protein LBB72_07270 [Spirochaetaceae bacterium]|jgi:hypothetical protein|nr:hypothetical protein [Spirochaetaceae bacterium]